MPALAVAAYWSCLLVAFVALRLNLSDVLFNIDELIPIKVSEAMRARDQLDPNWKFADLPWFWNRDQYNFYFYNIVAHGTVTLGSWLGAAPLPALRLANVVLQLCALGFAVDALRRLGTGAFGVAVGGALLAVAPGLVQDAGMARPESLLYLVSAVHVWILTLRLGELKRALLFGLALGVGCAIKVTYLTTGSLLMIAWLLSWDVRSWLLGTVALCAGVALGFAMAAPYAVLHPGVFMDGLAALAETYNSGLPPHSLPQFDLLKQARWISGYFLQLYGPVLAAALAAPFLLAGRQRRVAVAAVVFAALVFIYFIGKAVFFERNFSHVLIPLLLTAALAVAALRSFAWRFAATALLVFYMGYWSAQIAMATHDRDTAVARFEAANGLAPSERLPFDTSVDRKVPGRCDTVALIDHNDQWSGDFLAQLEAQGYRPIARYRGRFGALVTSTLHTYLDSDVHYLRCPDSKR